MVGHDMKKHHLQRLTGERVKPYRLDIVQTGTDLSYQEISDGERF